VSFIPGFRSIPGNKSIHEQLARQHAQNRVSHAQLFWGPQGCGNLPAALAYARLIHCENPGETEACGECHSCIMHQKLSHPDLHLVFPVPNVKVSAEAHDQDKEQKDATSDHFAKEWRSAVMNNPFLDLEDWSTAIEFEKKTIQISARESEVISRKLYLTPYEAKTKIMVIWYAEEMNASSSNKLLKIFEEPPPDSVILLLSEHRDKLLPTILSRVQQVRFSLPDQASLTEYIRMHRPEEPEPDKIAIMAQGNPNQALRILNGNAKEAAGSKRIMEWLRLCYKTDPVAIGKLTEDLNAAGRQAQKAFFTQTLIFLRAALMIKNNMGNLVHLPVEEQNFCTNFSKTIHLNSVEKMIEVIQNGFRSIEGNGNLKLILLDTTFQMNRCFRIPEKSAA